ncbi:MAG TPA: hypothetical protein PKM73_12575 [Verrucomicrobiota bacterium]|nr:hypothetical protein [Verrucomicrobiota bacterium]HNU52344.1 hypothetical protein [Verrucomicrobiota bacterium]
MRHHTRCLPALLAVLGFVTSLAAATNLPAYYAHPAAEDEHGVIAPWHPGQNGQLDERVRIAVDVLKRYPWAGTNKAVMAAPDFIYNSHWSITPEGRILIPPTTDWMCGDLCQRAWSTVKGLTAYYQYSGDPIAFVYIPLTVDYILDYALTAPDAAWPRFPISTPTRGKAYGRCDPRARNQLDLCAITGIEVLRAHKLTGAPRYRALACHWGDVFAGHAQLDDPAVSPWNRYADPSVVGWSDVLTGTTAVIVDFLEDLLAIGHRGAGDRIARARDAGRRFLEEQMLPAWWVNDTWGRTYWDWDNPMMCGMVSMCADHFLRQSPIPNPQSPSPTAYPLWRTDVRNMLSLLWNRNCADPASHGNVYSGAWAFPESSVCCGTSLSYNQYTAGPTLLRYAAAADSAWAREIGRRMMLMATYDSLPNGVVKDGLFGESVATGEWSNLAHPWPLCQVLEAIAWLPETFAPNRENHLVRSTSVVSNMVYQPGRIAYSTWDAPKGVHEVLRLSFRPASITANGRRLKERNALDAPGYVLTPLPRHPGANPRTNPGDWIVHVRHDRRPHLVIDGPDPQQAIDDSSLDATGTWQRVADPAAHRGSYRVADAAGAALVIPFSGNQVRVIGRVDPAGGWADVELDGRLEPTLVECWNPAPRAGQLLFARSGLDQGPHELRLIVRGEHNPLAHGARVMIDAVHTSDALGDAGYGSGGGPTDAQRLIFGYTGRRDYVDSEGHSWRPGTEFVARVGTCVDTVARCWWHRRRSMYIGGTRDEELYRYGVHAPEFWVHLTAGPGRYRLRLHWADTPETPWMEREGQWEPVSRPTTVALNRTRIVEALNVRTIAGTFKAHVREFEDVRPRQGIVELHFTSTPGHEAMIQALELIPDPRP